MWADYAQLIQHPFCTGVITSSFEGEKVAIQVSDRGFDLVEINVECTIGPLEKAALVQQIIHLDCHAPAVRLFLPETEAAERGCQESYV